MRAAASAIFGVNVERLHLQQLNLLLAIKACHQDFVNFRGVSASAKLVGGCLESITTGMIQGQLYRLAQA